MVGDFWVDGSGPDTKRRQNSAENKKGRLGIQKPKINEGLNKIGTNTWKKVRFCLDSGAGETVMAEGDLPEIPTKESWGSKHGQSYEVANGEEIDNLGEKRFVAHMVTTEGGDSGGKGIRRRSAMCTDP